ncbi:uncharacterized protein Z519_05397 [Cladophialophora bantiana CBS 173.52]|uniref:Uncharacterized protein n=1 Tax=Cladophialophora bantiana (strain ATCC 10958 / CBS 173.52 / CDC B-1940 / NIH 8579) TaxID=1442370 RepID=A0A0D2EW76_CLAB1|nr:uncharacterized protein Z519_05397 [Cladophialophora bantiana CBS 173.52]KIW94081.1 hypothetical protein Z519_05397 [Cladophialophora bantiana CBS 173.52]
MHDVEEWDRLFSIQERVGIGKALGMIRAQTQGPAFRYLSEQDDFSEEHVFNLERMKAEASSADEIFPETARRICVKPS